VTGVMSLSLGTKVVDQRSALKLCAPPADTYREGCTSGGSGRSEVLPGATQSWSGSVESVNSLIDALVRPTSETQRVVGAIADGDLSKKITGDVHGEMLELKNTVNAMVDQLNGFISEVTRVVRDVGTEGKLGQAAAVTIEVGGVWKDLTDNVNQLAANLTNQVRAISDVATAVTQGDLTRQVGVEANGEVAELKDKLNEMIRNLRETTRQNTEQDWLKTNLERFTRMLQGQRDLTTVSNLILSELAPLVSAQHAVFYAMTSPSDGSEPLLKFEAGYGYEERKHLLTTFRVGQGLVGQCAKEKQRILLTEVPPDYVRINSGLGDSTPLNIIVLPVLFEGSVRAVVELASFSPFSEAHQTFLDQLPESIGLVLNTIEADTLTENLLKRSQSQAEELRAQQAELRESNEDLERQTKLLAQQNVEAGQNNGTAALSTQ
jgi:HAMP domain-containing protein